MSREAGFLQMLRENQDIYDEFIMEMMEKGKGDLGKFEHRVDHVEELLVEVNQTVENLPGDGLTFNLSKKLDVVVGKGIKLALNPIPTPTPLFAHLFSVADGSNLTIETYDGDYTTELEALSLTTVKLWDGNIYTIDSIHSDYPDTTQITFTTPVISIGAQQTYIWNTAVTIPELFTDLVWNSDGRTLFYPSNLGEGINLDEVVSVGQKFMTLGGNVYTIANILMGMGWFMFVEEPIISEPSLSGTASFYIPTYNPKSVDVDIGDGIEFIENTVPVLVGVDPVFGSWTYWNLEGSVNSFSLDDDNSNPISSVFYKGEGLVSDGDVINLKFPNSHEFNGLVVSNVNVDEGITNFTITPAVDFTLTGSAFPADVPYTSMGAYKVTGLGTYKVGVKVNNSFVQSTLTALGWDSGTKQITVSVVGVTTSNNLIIQPDPTSFLDWYTAGIRAVSQTNGTITFQCETVPSGDLIAVIAIFN